MGFRASESGLAPATVISWIAVAAWAVFIFMASAHTGSDFQNATDWLGQLKQQLDAWLTQADIPGFTESSSIGHFAEYLILGALLANALGRHGSPAFAWLAAVAVASLYGITDELHQLFVPGRFCDPADWMVDTVGAALGALLLKAACVGRRRHGRSDA